MPEGQPGAGQPAGAPAPGGAPSAAPANPMQMMLAQMFQATKRMAQSNPALSSGAAKVAEGIQEMQTALMMNRPSNPSPEQNPPQ